MKLRFDSERFRIRLSKTEQDQLMKDHRIYEEFYFSQTLSINILILAVQDKTPMVFETKGNCIKILLNKASICSGETSIMIKTKNDKNIQIKYEVDQPCCDE